MVKRLCGLLSVSRSAYYAYVSGGSHHICETRSREVEKVAEVFRNHKRRYGARRIMHELREDGMNIGRKRIGTIMKELGIRAIQLKSFVPRTTVPNDSILRSPNLLLDSANTPRGINELVVGDITYLPRRGGGWLYLCVWMDSYSRFIGGWKVDDNMEASIATESLEMLLRRRKVSKGMIVHSDGGGQFKSKAFRALLAKQSLRQSMTRIDNHYDNAFAESLFSRRKAELMDEYPLFDECV